MKNTTDKTCKSRSVLFLHCKTKENTGKTRKDKLKKKTALLKKAKVAARAKLMKAARAPPNKTGIKKANINITKDSLKDQSKY